jgi:hypothetical protein
MSSVMAQLAATTFQQLDGNRFFPKTLNLCLACKMPQKAKHGEHLLCSKVKRPTKLQDSLRVHMFHWV